MATKEEQQELLYERVMKGAVAQLSDHFDTVQIVATVDGDDDMPRYFELGTGNMFVRAMSAKMFVDSIGIDTGFLVSMEEEDDEEDELV